MSEIKLGVLLDESAQRDAIHVAIAPMVAAQILQPGEHVGLIHDEDRGVRAGRNGENIGIVDPFLTEPVMPGQRFYLFLYPNTVTSLRHEWTHPAFPDVAAGATDRSLSEQWLRNFAEEVGVSYGVLMDAAATWIRTSKDDRWGGDYHTFYGHGTPDAVHTKKAEMWHHYEIVTGTKVADHEATFFTCSC